MSRTLLSLGIVLTVGCTTVVMQPTTGGATGSTGNSTGTTGSSTGTTGSSTGTTGSATSGTGATGTSGSTTGTTGSATSGTGATGTSGSSTGTTGSSTGTTGSSTGTTGSSTGTTGSSTGTTGSSTGTTGSSTGTTGSSTGTSGGTTGGALVVGPGTYDLTSQFNLVDALPPDVQTAVNLTLEFTMSPGNFLLDVAGRLPVIKYVIDAIDLFSGIHDQIAGSIDDYINSWSGGMVTTMQGISKDVEMALRGLKMKNTLVLSAPSSGTMTVQDSLDSLVFTYQGTDYSYPQGATATATATLTGLQLKIAGHTYNKGVRIGSMLVDLIDNVALPQLTGVNSLGELLNQLVNCGGIGTATEYYLFNFPCIDGTCITSLITGDDIAKLCVNGLDAVGQSIENQLSQLDAPGMMSVSDASCLAVENKGTTGHADTLMNGQWSLTIPVGVGTMPPLPGTFTGVLGPDAGSH